MLLNFNLLIFVISITSVLISCKTPQSQDSATLNDVSIGFYEQLQEKPKFDCILNVEKTSEQSVTAKPYRLFRVRVANPQCSTKIVNEIYGASIHSENGNDLLMYKELPRDQIQLNTNDCQSWVNRGGPDSICTTEYDPLTCRTYIKHGSRASTIQHRDVPGGSHSNRCNAIKATMAFACTQTGIHGSPHMRYIAFPSMTFGYTCSK